MDLLNLKLGIPGNMFVILPFIIFFPGFILVRTLFKIKTETSFLERLFIQILISTVISSLIGFILAFLGKFSMQLIVFSNVGLCLLFIVLARFKFTYDKRDRPKPDRYDLLFLPFLLLGIFLFFHPAEYIHGGWDPGVYMNGGINLSKTGSLYIEDSLWQQLSDEERILFESKSAPDRFDSFKIINTQTGKSLPYFYHLYPVWIGIFHQLFGNYGGFFVNPFFALLSLLAFFCLFSTVVPRKYAFFILPLLVFNILQIWFARFPCSEIITQFFLAGSLYGLLKFWKGENSFAVLVAGCFLAAFLCRLTSILILFPFFLILMVSLLEERKNFTRLFLYIIPVLFGALFYYFAIAFPTTRYLVRTVFKTALPFSKIAFFLFLFLACFYIIVFLLEKKTSLKKIIPAFLSGNLFSYVLSVLIALFFIWLYFLRPAFSSDKDAPNLLLLGSVLSPLLILTSVIGMITFVLSEKSIRMRLLTLCFLCFMIVFLIEKRAHSSYFWAFRRYITMVIPGFVFFAAYLLSRIWQLKQIIGKILACALLVLLIAIPCYGFRFLFIHRDLGGATQFYNAIAEDIPDDAIVVCDGDWIATPLRFIFGKEVVEIMYPTIQKCSAIEKTFSRWLNEGFRVFYITEESSIYSDQFLFRNTAIQSWFSSSLRRLYNTIPKEIDKFKQSVKIYEITHVQNYDFPSKNRGFPYRVDLGKNCFGLSNNWYPPREYSLPSETSKTWRWTSGSSTIQLKQPFDSLKEIEITARSQRPDESEAASTSITLNSLQLDTIRFDKKEGFTTISIPVPNNWERTDNEINLQIQTNPWKPSQFGLSDDSRNLGIQIEKIVLRNSEETVIDIGNEHENISIDGFYNLECAEKTNTFCRWTSNKSDIIIPWFGNDVENIVRIRAASSRPDEISPAHIRLFIDGELIGEATLRENMAIYTFHVTARKVSTNKPNRAVLTIETTNPWDPSTVGITGYEKNMGILVDWIEIE